MIALTQPRQRSAAKPQTKERGIYSASAADHAWTRKYFHATKRSDAEAE
jgi:hypothetical protein